MKVPILLAAILFSSIQLYAEVPASMKVSVNAIKSLIENWDNAHNKKRSSSFKTIYADHIEFYGQWSSIDRCIEKKKDLFTEYPTYSQKIVSDPSLSGYPEKSVIKCDFIMQIKKGTQVKEYAFYLIIRKSSSGYRIIGEGDAITDQTFHITHHLGVKRPIINTDNITSTQPAKRQDDPDHSILPTILYLLMIVLIWSIGRRLFLKSKRNSKTQSNKYSHHDPTYSSEYSGPTVTIHKTTDSTTTGKQYRREPVIVDVEPVTVEEGSLTNEEKGYLFEAFIAKKFNRRYFKLVDWRSDKRASDIFPESNMYPDLHYKFKNSKPTKEFAIECKFRTDIFKDRFDINAEQIKRYRIFQDERQVDVYLALGLRGTPEAPDELFLIPLKELTCLEYKCLIPYKKNPQQSFYMDLPTLKLH